MRVIAGVAKGRNLLSVPGAGTRPVTDLVKGALFNILGPDVVGATFLDLFAGTGSVGIEALSRGASLAVFVEVARKAVATVQKNLELTGLAERAQVIHEDVFRFLRQADPEQRFDYIYVAPPQYQDLWVKTLLALNEKPLLTAEGRIVVQIHPKEFHPLSTPRLRLVDERHYGDTALYFYALSDQGETPTEPEDVD